LHLQEATQRFYSHFPDAYDFLAIVAEPRFTENRHYHCVRNSIQGIGMGLFDGSQGYGSAGRLMGIVHYPVGVFFDFGETGTSHEVAHHAANWLSVPAMQGVQAHWPISSLARGILSINGWASFPYALTPLGGGDYRLDGAQATQTFNDMELYLMGLVPASQVGEHFVFVNQNQPLCDGCILYGPSATLRVADVIAQHGPRVPAYPDAPRTFRLATIVVSMDRLLTPREMAFLDHFAARGEATQPLPYTLGFSRGTTLPFYLATGGRGSFVTSLAPQAPCSRGPTGGISHDSATRALRRENPPDGDCHVWRKCGRSVFERDLGLPRSAWRAPQPDGIRTSVGSF
jgi:hypothetical protein